MGNPEWYVLTAQLRGSTKFTHRTYLDWINSENRWYWIGDRGLMYFWWDNAYHPVTGFKFMEEDWGAWKTDVGLSIGGVGIKFSVSNGEDTVGTRYVDRNQVSWGGYQTLSTGKVRFQVDKDY